MKRGDLGYWAWRAKVGAPKKIPTPEILWEVACKYFEMRDESPWLQQDFIKGGEQAGKIIHMEKAVPYTWMGLEDYLREHGYAARLDDYRANKNNSYTEYSYILTHISQIIQDQKFTGAAVGAFNPMIISRDLGLTEKTQSTIVQEQPLFPEGD